MVGVTSSQLTCQFSTTWCNITGAECSGYAQKEKGSDPRTGYDGGLQAYVKINEKKGVRYRE